VWYYKNITERHLNCTRFERRLAMLLKNIL
jgi:hypothetical protein